MVALLLVLLAAALRSGPTSTAYAHGDKLSPARAARLLANSERVTPADARASYPTGSVARAASVPSGSHWLGSWATSAQAPTLENTQSMQGFHDVTLREIAFLTSAGSEVRVHLTNAYGSRPLVIGKATVAISTGGGSVSASSVRSLEFAGQGSVTIPVGAQVVSDPVQLSVRALQRLAVSVYVPDTTGPATGHYDSHVINYAGSGAHVRNSSGRWFPKKIDSWFFVDGIDVLAPKRYIGAVAALGDSITAGVGSVTDAYANWPDDLARRLSSLGGETMSVLNEGIGGNRVLNGSECCGAAAVNRFTPDVLDETGVRDVILLEGINDIGYSEQTNPLTAPHTDVSAAQIIAGDEQIIAEAHAAGLRIFGATLLPFEGARYWTPANELKREQVNNWILTSGAFNGVINFASIMADPSNPLRLNPAFDSGDHLHPNDAGYRAMANAISLELLLKG